MFDKSVLDSQLKSFSPAQFQAPSPVAPTNYSTNAGIQNVMQNLNAEPGGWWQKTKDFFGSPFGRSVGAGLLTGGLVAATGGDGLEALSYGAQAGGRAADVSRNELARKAKRELEEKYFNSKLAEQQADREARQQELKDKAQQNRDLEDYRYQLETQKMYKENELAFNRTLQTEQAKNIAELEKEQNSSSLNAEKQYQLATSNLSELENLVKNNPDLVGFYAPAKVAASRLTEGNLGFDSLKMKKRGEIVRNLGSIRNDLIAQAKANGQSGINTAREIEMATAGLNENSSAEEIMGALQYMNKAAKKVRDLSVSNQMTMIPSVGNNVSDVIDYTEYMKEGA